MVCEVERVSPSFVRVSFTGPELADMGTPGATFDQRVKIIFPGGRGAHVPLEADGDWYRNWLDMSEEARGAMRTYSLRHVEVRDGATILVVDFVLHLDPESSGPASQWADAARIGDRVTIVGPRRGFDNGGVEFDAGRTRALLLAGDETAAPAIARILEDLDGAAEGVAFIEVPLAADELAVDAPPGVTVHWLAREGRPHGELLTAAVVDFLGSRAQVAPETDAGDDLVWETPRYSSLGEDIADGAETVSERYLWFAGESAVVTALRRHVVNELGTPRADVAFMGYWRRGVAMRG